ncbi:MAG TPA: NADH-quinone oxidoreductase subunit G, partial [Sphingomonas sp.]|nr:NADH-quinone oxidoreductase subunit G [Sphingomonas sp.]
SLAGLREAMAGEVPALREPGLATFDWAPPTLSATASGVMEGYPIKDFYLTNAICRASPTMQRCSAELLHGEEFAEAAE